MATIKYVELRGSVIGPKLNAWGFPQPKFHFYLWIEYGLILNVRTKSQNFCILEKLHRSTPECTQKTISNRLPKNR